MRAGNDTRQWIAEQRLRGQRLRGGGRAGPEDVVSHLTAMQAQEHAWARWAVAQRTGGPPSASAVDGAFDDGRFLRTHVLRPTWHYVAAGDLRWLMGLSGPRVDRGNARRYAELGLAPRTLNRSNDVIAEAVDGGARTRSELAGVLEKHRISTGGQRLAYMLMRAELSAVVCSGPMRGPQHTYAAFDRRVPPDPGPGGDSALAELAWRYFSTRGPATLLDFSWWSGLRAEDARSSLAMARDRLTSSEVDDRTYWFVDRRGARSSSGIDLVHCYDELIISYTQSRDILRSRAVTFPVPRHLDGFRHVLLVDGRLLGHWRTRTDAGGTHVDTRTGRALSAPEKVALGDAIDRYRRFSQLS